MWGNVGSLVCKKREKCRGNSGSELVSAYKPAGHFDFQSCHLLGSGFEWEQGQKSIFSSDRMLLTEEKRVKNSQGMVLKADEQVLNQHNHHKVVRAAVNCRLLNSVLVSTLMSTIWPDLTHWSLVQGTDKQTHTAEG